MRTNIEFDVELLSQATAAAGLSTKRMILVDASVWIARLRTTKRRGPQSWKTPAVQEAPRAGANCGPVVA
jgi:hypothetical protein